MGMNLSRLGWLRRGAIGLKRWLYVRIFGMDIHPSAQFSLSTKFDLTNPRGVHVGADSYVAFGVAVLTHDLTRGVRLHTRVGERCFIGCRSILMPGVHVGDGSIVGAGSVVTASVPPDTIVAGNPAVVLRTGIDAGRYGRLPTADARQRHDAQAHQLD